MKLVFDELVAFDGIDENDGERIEIRLGGCFWANKKKLAYLRKKTLETIGEGWENVETEYDLPINYNQKYIYILEYEYCLPNGTEYWYQFEPQTSKCKCKAQIEMLSKDSKYSYSSERIYKSGNNGWSIEKYEIVY